MSDMLNSSGAIAIAACGADYLGDCDRLHRSPCAPPKVFTMRVPSSRARRFVVACALLSAVTFGANDAQAQTRDSLLNGAVIGAAVGAGVGVFFTHAVRDSDLSFGQYAYGGLVFGALGAGVGLGVDALFNRASPRPHVTQRRVVIAPTVWRETASVRVHWRF